MNRAYDNVKLLVHIPNKSFLIKRLECIAITPSPIHFAYTYHILIIYCRSPFNCRHELEPFFAIRFYLPFLLSNWNDFILKINVSRDHATYFFFCSGSNALTKLKRQCNIHFHIHSLNTNCTSNFNSNCYVFLCIKCFSRKYTWRVYRFMGPNGKKILFPGAYTIEISKQNVPRVSKLNNIDAYNVVTHTHIAFYLKSISLYIRMHFLFSEKMLCSPIFQFYSDLQCRHSIRVKGSIFLVA